MTTKQSVIHVGIDVSKDKLTVAIPGGGVRDEVLSLGTFYNTLPASTGCSRNLRVAVRLSQYAMKRDLWDMVFIGRCDRSISSAV